ncbi:MAG: hypothetical protein AB7F86_05030 [Bdellovibrionales bacterium]
MRKITALFALVLGFFGFSTAFAKEDSESVLKSYNFKVEKKDFTEVRPGQQDF